MNQTLDYRFRGFVDNQLGNIHSARIEKPTKLYPFSKGLELTQYGKKLSNVMISRDVIPVEAAKRARQFIQDIPFDDSLPLLNNTDNQPRDSIYKSLDQCDKVKQAFLNKVLDPKQWMWEKYHSDFWRATPLTLNAFIGSPLFELIDLLEKRWITTSIPGIDFDTLFKTVWVLQRTPQGYGIDQHYDEFKGRCISFIYYLTPDDWSSKDGGNLHVMNEETKEYEIITPEFNTLITWNMTYEKSPLHWVSSVTADNSRPRIALVGFWSQKNL